MKSVIATLFITITLLAAVPVANAATTQRPRTTKSAVTRDEAASDRFAAFRKFVNRTVRRIASHTGIIIPTPKPEDEEPEQ